MAQTPAKGQPYTQATKPTGAQPSLSPEHAPDPAASNPPAQNLHKLLFVIPLICLALALVAAGVIGLGRYLPWSRDAQTPPASTQDDPYQPSEQASSISGRKVEFWTNSQVTFPTIKDIGRDYAYEADNDQVFCLSGNHNSGTARVVIMRTALYGSLEESLDRIVTAFIEGKEAELNGTISMQRLDKGKIETESGASIYFEAVGLKQGRYYTTTTIAIIDTSPRATVFMFFDNDEDGFPLDFIHDSMKSITVDTDAMTGSDSFFMVR
jgi:hypothetical protein